MWKPIAACIDADQVLETKGDSNLLMCFQLRQVDEDVCLECRPRKAVLMPVLLMVRVRLLLIVIRPIVPSATRLITKATQVPQINHDGSPRVAGKSIPTEDHVPLDVQVRVAEVEQPHWHYTPLPTEIYYRSYAGASDDLIPIRVELWTIRNTDLATPF
jgi:hypothetical protein